MAIWDHLTILVGLRGILLSTNPGLATRERAAIAPSFRDARP
jgi:hypothetical protein